jgi:hypothetical protein
MKAPRVHVRIDRLVLRGMTREDRDAFVASFERELSRQLVQPRVSSEFQSCHVPALRAKPSALPRDASPKQLGASAARALAQGLKG